MIKLTPRQRRVLIYMSAGHRLRDVTPTSKVWRIGRWRTTELGVQPINDLRRHRLIKPLIQSSLTGRVFSWQVAAAGKRLAARHTGQCWACGCTEHRACPGGCGWAAANLCTSCDDHVASPKFTPKRCARSRERGPALRSAAGAKEG